MLFKYNCNNQYCGGARSERVLIVLSQRKEANNTSNIHFFDIVQEPIVLLKPHSASVVKVAALLWLTHKPNNDNLLLILFLAFTIRSMISLRSNFITK